MNRWDERYSQYDYAYGLDPNDFLVEQAEQIPQGRVLCLAEGEGRNALHLARCGYDVLAVDQSKGGLDKDNHRAKLAGVEIATQVADLAEYHIRPGKWRGIVSIWAHVPPTIRKPLHRQVVAGLAPGGGLILEAYTPRQLEIGGIGGPKHDQRDRLMTLAELEEELAGLSMRIAQEIEREPEQREQDDRDGGGAGHRNARRRPGTARGRPRCGVAV